MPARTQTLTTFVGSDTCRTCHAAEHAAWTTSQHAQAMQPATPTTVLAAFDGRELRHRVERVRPVHVDGAFYFEIADPDGGWTRHAVRHTFGVYPLQQYLVEQPKGRLQAFNWCWDARPLSAGGQRWFYLHPEDTDEPRTPLHWAGLLQNWNHQCAECHVTDVRKGTSPQPVRSTRGWPRLASGARRVMAPARCTRGGRVFQRPSARQRSTVA